MSTYRPIANLISNFTVKHNGCPLPVTHFTASKDSEDRLTRQLYNLGSEISSYTDSQVPNDYEDGVEVAKGANWLRTAPGIPSSAIQGFRAPGLTGIKDETFEFVKAASLSYDASIEDRAAPSNTISPSQYNRIWPYTMDYGNPNCPTCSRSFSGLWEVRASSLVHPNGTLLPLVDALSADVDDVYDILTYNFAQVYSGNRSPLMFSLRANWLNDVRQLEALKEFVAYARQFDDVYFVTIQQLLQWIKAPRVASQTGSLFPANCPAAQYQVCLGPPKDGCQQGLFSWHTCRCLCTQNWCRNEAGSCAAAVQQSAISCPTHSDPLEGSPDGQPDPDPIFNFTKPVGKNGTLGDESNGAFSLRGNSPFQFSSVAGVITSCLMGLALLFLAYGL